MTKIVVTGASGFLGSHLIKRLSGNKDAEVYAMSSKDGNGELTGIEYIPNSVVYDNSAADVFRDAIVVNCAFPRNSSGTGMADGLLFVKNVFEKAADFGAAAIINISSQSVYSPNRTEPADENSPVCLESPYAVGKYATELMLESVCRGRKTKYTNIRMASLIGPGFDQRIVNRFVKQALDNAKLTVITSNQQFGFLDIEDAVTGIVAIISNKEAAWKCVYNLGISEGYDIVLIAEEVYAALAYCQRIELCLRENQEALYQNSTLCSNRITEDFGWVPAVSLKQSIRQIVEYEVKNNARN